MNNSLLSTTHIVREHVVHIENERMSLSNSFGYHSMMSFHSSIEDEFLIDEFSLFIMKTSFSSQRRTRRTPADYIDSHTVSIVATFELRHEVSTILIRRHTDSHIVFIDCGFCIDYSRMAASNIYDVLRGDIRATTSFIRPKRAEQDIPDCCRAGHSWFGDEAISSTTPESSGDQ